MPIQLKAIQGLGWLGDDIQTIQVIILVELHRQRFEISMIRDGRTELMDVSSLVDAGHAELVQLGKLLELLADGLTPRTTLQIDNTKSMQGTQLSNLCANLNAATIKFTFAQLGQKIGCPTSTWPAA